MSEMQGKRQRTESRSQTNMEKNNMRILQGCGGCFVISLVLAIIGSLTARDKLPLTQPKITVTPAPKVREISSDTGSGNISPGNHSSNSSVSNASTATEPGKPVNQTAKIARTPKVTKKSVKIAKKTNKPAEADSKSSLWSFLFAGVDKDIKKANTEIAKATPINKLKFHRSMPETIASPPRWRRVKKFVGNSDKITARFKISGTDWRVDWKTLGGANSGGNSFQLYILRDNGEVKDIAANSAGGGSDTADEHDPGVYYLKFTTSQPYSVTIEEFR